MDTAPTSFDEMPSVKLIKGYHGIPRALIVFWPALLAIVFAAATFFPPLPQADLYPRSFNATIFVAVSALLVAVGCIKMITNAFRWFRTLPPTELDLLATAKIPEIAQSGLATTVIVRNGRIRRYDLIPIVFQTLEHRERTKADLQARKAVSDLRSKEDASSNEKRATEALLRRFVQASSSR